MPFRKNGVAARSFWCIGREDEKLKKNDEIVSLDLVRRLYHRLGEVCWQRAIRYGYEGGPPDDAAAGTWIALARESFDRSIAADDNVLRADLGTGLGRAAEST